MDRLPKTESAPPDQKPLRLVISDLTVDNLTVVLLPGLPSLSLEITLNLSSIHLKNPGAASINPNQLVEQGLGSLLNNKNDAQKRSPTTCPSR